MWIRHNIIVKIKKKNVINGSGLVYNCLYYNHEIKKQYIIDLKRCYPYPKLIVGDRIKMTRPYMNMTRTYVFV